MRSIQNKKLTMFSVCVCFVIILTGFFFHFKVNASKPEQNSYHAFDQIIKEYHLTVSGPGRNLTKSAFQDLIEEIKDETVLEKYENKISTNGKEIKLTPEDIL